MLSRPLVGLESIFYHSEKDVIRTLLRTGAVPSARVGRKYLVTIEALEAYLGGSVGPEKPVKAQSKKWQIK